MKGDLFTNKNKPKKRKLESIIFNTIGLHTEGNCGDIITLGGPNPESNFRSIEPYLSENSNYIAVEMYDDIFFNKMRPKLKKIKDKRIICAHSDIIDIIDPEKRFLKDFQINNISFIDLDFCKSINILSDPDDKKSFNNIITVFKKLIKSGKLSDNFGISLTFCIRQSGRMNQSFYDSNSIYRKNRWLRDYTEDVVENILSPFKKSYSSELKINSPYKDYHGSYMVKFLHLYS